MVFEFEHHDVLPPLAWCARVQPGGVIRVRHGSGVEVRGDAFVEGAWDGEFGSMAFDEATTLAGSGGRIRDNTAVFSSPFHPLECLYLLEGNDCLYVSNSLAFVLVEAGDRPDILYKDYFFDVLRHARHGVPNLPAGMPTAAGGRVRLFQVCNLHVDRDLTCREVPKRLSDPPTCFADYRGQLLQTVTKVAENAAAPERSRTYRMVSAVSRGYDSTAVAALASQAGGAEAVTYRRSYGGGKLVDDSGAEIAASLGMTTTEYDRTDVRNLAGFPEAEFFSKPDGNATLGLRLMQAQLNGVLFMTGRHGEDVWGLGRDCTRKGLREPENTTMPGRGLADFRVRVGYLNFPGPYIGALHGAQIYRITHAREMDPWRLGVGKYDRPIARRIAEEAGVPRTLFGQRKIGGGGRSLRRLNEASEQDFRAFCQAEVPTEILERLDPRKAYERDWQHFRMSFIRKRCARHPTLHPVLDLLPLDRWHAMWNSVYLYTFHWGFERTSPRYRV